MAQHSTNLTPEEQRAANVKHILTVMGILTAITAVEFVFAFIMKASMLRTSIFLVLTVFKAFYIVADFMHLRHEVKMLIWSILIPIAFVVWFVVAMMMEGNSIVEFRFLNS